MGESSGREKTYIVVGKVQTPEGKEGSHCKKKIRQLLERSPFHEGASFPGYYPRPDNGESDGRVSNKHEAHHTNSPLQTNRRKQLLRNSREDHPAGCSTSSGKGHGQCTSLITKVCTDERDHGTKGQAITESNADALGKQELAVSRRLGGCEDSNDLEGTSHGQGGPQIPSVESAAGKCGNGKDEEELDGSHPRDI